MSNPNPSADEQEAVESNEEQVDDSSSQEADDENKASQESSDSEKNQAVKDKIFQGMIDSEFEKYISDPDYNLENINGDRLKEEVSKKIDIAKSKLSPQKKDNEIDEDSVLEKLEAKAEVKQDKKFLSEEDQKTYDESIDDFTSHGYSLADAVFKTRKIMGVDSPEERQEKADNYAMGAIPVSPGSIVPQTKKQEIKPTTDGDKTFVKALEEQRGIKI